MVEKRLAVALLLGNLLFAAPLAAQAATATATAPASRLDDVIWHWYVECAAQVTMKVEVVQRGKLVFATTFPMCPLRRDRIPVPKIDRPIVFQLSDARLRLFGEPPGTRFEGNLWEAGMETNGLLLGLTFTTPGKVAYRAQIFAEPTKAVEQKVASSVLIRVSPMPR